MLDRVSSFEIVCKRRNRMRKTEMKLVMALAAVLVGSLMLSPVMAADNGFDEFGYNYKARVFVGKADGVDRVLDGKVWGDPTYANDWLVMKWSKAWDDARFNGAPWTPDAWCDNEWNGMVPGGSREITHYKIIWVGPELESSPYWRAGGYTVWSEFEVIMDQGVIGGAHYWGAHAIPTGYGA
jgi:hypothetical protein